MNNVLKLLLLLALCSCEGHGDGSSTPEAYKYVLREAARPQYSNDTTALRPILTKMLVDHVRPFNLKMYDNQTDLIIDSLVYSPDQYRMIVFVIVRNSTSKMLRRGSDSAYYYDAYYLYCSRDGLNESIKVYDYSGYRLSFFYNYSEISEALRDHCFNRLLKSEGTEQHFNMDDKRFWNSKDFEWVMSNSTEIHL